MNKKKRTIICPECGTSNEHKANTCVMCGYILNKKRKLKLIIILFLIVVLFVCGCFGIRQIQINNSNKAFLTAQEFEEKEEYKSALQYYSRVIRLDSSNYSIAQTKIDEINELLIEHKLCAKCVLAATNCGSFNESEIIDIYIADEDHALGVYSKVFGNDTVVIISEYMSTNCCYIVSNQRNATIAESFPVEKDSLTGLYVHQIGVENYKQGWLASGWNSVTDTYINQSKTYCKKMKKELVRYYLNKYYDTKDLSILSEEN